MLSGFTGTLWNAITMYHKLNILPEAGTDAKTLRVLLEKSRASVDILKGKGDSIEQRLIKKKLTSMLS